MGTDISLPDTFDLETLRWPPRCIYCGQSKHTEIQTKIEIANKKRATIHVPYCTQHSQEATRNKRIIDATWWCALVVCILVTIGVLVRFWPTIFFLPCQGIDCIEMVLGLISFAAFVAGLTARLAVQLAVRALSRSIPSLKDSDRLYGFLGLHTYLEKNALRLSFVTDEIATDFKRLNSEFLMSEPPLRPVPHQQNDHRSQSSSSSSSINPAPPATTPSYGVRLLLIFGIAVLSFITFVSFYGLVMVVVLEITVGTRLTGDFWQDEFPFILIMIAIVGLGSLGIYKLVQALRK